LTQRILTKLLFPVPPLAEQRRIIAKANQLMTLVDELERHISASREIGANLLNAVVAQLVV
jgi:type I restriction enzyme S subunit